MSETGDSDLSDLIALLQCLGYEVKAVQNTDGNASQDPGEAFISINCPVHCSSTHRPVMHPNRYLPDEEGRALVFRIIARSMRVERDIRYDVLAKLCPNSTVTEIRAVCMDAGMITMRARRKVTTEKDFLQAIVKFIETYIKLSPTPLYMT